MALFEVFVTCMIICGSVYAWFLFDTISTSFTGSKYNMMEAFNNASKRSKVLEEMITHETSLIRNDLHTIKSLKEDISTLQNRIIGLENTLDAILSAKKTKSKKIKKEEE